MKNVADIYALSPMQKLMLVHARTAGSGHDLLLSQIVYEISGALQGDAYRRAWELMIERHPALRTMFVWQDKQEPLQVVRETVSLPWSEEDWRGLPPAEQQSALTRLLAADRAAGFDLLRPPLMRLILIRLGEQKSWLVWSSHHLIIDRWCISILLGETRSAYEAFIAGEHPHLPPAPRYRDYIGWLAQKDEAQSRDYWREALRDFAPRPLPLLPPTSAEPEPAALRSQIGGAVLDRLRQLAAKNDLTLNTLVTSIWAIIVAKAVGADDLLLGLTVSGRPPELPGVSNAVGCFINNVPLRVRLDNELSLQKWQGRLQEDLLALHEHEHASLAQIQEWSAIKSPAALFETVIIFQAPVNTAAPEGLNLALLRGGTQTGYPIALSVVPDADMLRLALAYDAQRLPPGMAEQLHAALQQLLEALAGDPQVTLAALRALAVIDPPREMAAGAGRKMADQRPYMPPRTAAEQALAQIWAEILRLPHVGIDDRFFALGGDSIGAIQLLDQMEGRLGQSAPISLLFSDPTLAQLAEAIGDEGAARAIDPVLLPVNADGSEPPFFYAHGVFGDVSSLTNIVPHFPASQPLYGLQAYGLHGDHEPDRTIEEMAAHALDAMRRVQPSGPYRLGGFCFGGVLAYEIARQLEQAGEEIALLAIIEGSAPREFHQPQPFYAPERLQIIRHSAPQILRGHQEFGGWRLSEKIRRRLGKQSAGGMAKNGRDPWGLEFDNLADFNALRPARQHRLRDINVAAVEQYRPGSLRGRITLFRAGYLPAKHTFLAKIDPQRGWGRLAAGGVEIHTVAGTHIGVLRQPHAAQLTAALVQALKES